MRRLLLLAVAVASLCGLLQAQDSPSLGDVARQARLQKQQKDPQSKYAGKPSVNKDGQDTDAKPAEPLPQKTTHVITNEELPERTPDAAGTYEPKTPTESDISENSSNHEAGAEHWKSQIQAQKNAIASLQREISSLSSSIHYAGANCVANCVQWNERQQQKQQQVESMKAQLEEQQRRLEEMQEEARKQGFGSSVYDP